MQQGYNELSKRLFYFIIILDFESNKPLRASDFYVSFVKTLGFACVIFVYCSQPLWLMQYSNKMVGFSLKSRNQKNETIVDY